MPPGRNIREPSMPPSMEKVKGEKLRTGWTTGACAAAAAKAAASALKSGKVQEEVEIRLPRKGQERRVRFPVERCEVSGASWAEAVVVKDAGDDPDVTDGAHLTARISWREEPGPERHRRVGVGRRWQGRGRRPGRNRRCTPHRTHLMAGGARAGARPRRGRGADYQTGARTCCWRTGDKRCSATYDFLL